MIDGPPQVVGDTVDLHENLVEVSPPVGQGPPSLDPLATDLGGEHWAEAVPPAAHSLVADLDPAFVQQIFDVVWRERVTDIAHHRPANDSGAHLEGAKAGALGHAGRLRGQVRSGRSRTFLLRIPIEPSASRRIP